MPAREDFAIEKFGDEALIIRLDDMRLFKINKHALILFELLLETGCVATAVASKPMEQEADLESKDIESVHKILFSM